MNAKTNERLWMYMNALRGTISHGDYITASVLVNEVKKQNENADAEQAYVALLEAADKLGVKNPFRDKEHFYMIYQESLKAGEIDWEGAIVLEASSSRMPLIPAPLVDVYMERLAAKPESVLIAEAERFVPNLKKIVDASINSSFVLTTQNMLYATALQNVFEDYENVEVLLTDIYHYGFVDKRFDLIMSCPAFGGRNLADDKTFMCRELDMVALENLSLHLNGGGRLVILLPGRVTFSSGKIRDLRQFIQTSYTIKEISELPEGTLESIGIKVYLLDIENSRPGDDDITIRRYTAGEKKSRRAAIESLDIADDTFVMLSELEEQGDWSIDRIFAQQDEEYLQYQSSSVRKDMIGNVAQVFRGKAVSKKDPSGNIGVVNISNIGEYEIDYEGLDHIKESERKVSNYLLQDGDVLLPARGTAIRTAVFKEQNYPCIASANVIVIRPDSKVLDSTYLKLFLDSPIGNKLISGAQQGMAVMNISYKDLNVLEVPVPSMANQKEAAKEYSEELEKFRATVAEAEARWNEVLAKLQNF